MTKDAVKTALKNTFDEYNKFPGRYKETTKAYPEPIEILVTVRTLYRSASYYGERYAVAPEDLERAMNKIHWGKSGQTVREVLAAVLKSYPHGMAEDIEYKDLLEKVVDYLADKFVSGTLNSGMTNFVNKSISSLKENKMNRKQIEKDYIAKLRRAGLINEDKLRKLNEGMSSSARIVIFSHLSDIQHEVNSKSINNRINFIKTLLQQYDNLQTSIDPDKEWEEFTKTRFFQESKKPKLNESDKPLSMQPFADAIKAALAPLNIPYLYVEAGDNITDSVFIKLSLDPKETWKNTYWENSRRFSMHLFPVRGSKYTPGDVVETHLSQIFHWTNYKPRNFKGTDPQKMAARLAKDIKTLIDMNADNVNWRDKKPKPVMEAYKPGQTISDATPIIPEIIADGVADQDRELSDYLVARAERHFANNEQFRKQIMARGNKGRDTLESFMNHWAQAYRENLTKPNPVNAKAISRDK